MPPLPVRTVLIRLNGFVKDKGAVFNRLDIGHVFFRIPVFIKGDGSGYPGIADAFQRHP